MVDAIDEVMSTLPAARVTMSLSRRTPQLARRANGHAMVGTTCAVLSRSITVKASPKP